MSGLFWSHRSDSLIDAFDSAAVAVSSAAPSTSPGPRDSHEAREANERLDQLLLVCSAMWDLLREKTSLTENDLIAKVAEIDARDGTADGKMTYTPKKCPKCARTIFPKHHRCLYCGAEIPIDNVFKSI